MGNCYCIRLHKAILSYVKIEDTAEKIIGLFIENSSHLTRADFSVELVYIPAVF